MKIISLNKVFFGYLLVTSLLVTPSNAQTAIDTFAPFIDIAIAVVGTTFDIVNTVTGFIGIAPLSIQGIISLIGSVLVPDIEATVLAGVCDPVNSLLGDVGDCVCTLSDSGAAADLAVNILCTPVDDTDPYCFDAPDALQCGPLTASGLVIIPLGEALSAVANSGAVNATAVPKLCVALDGEDICATGDLIQEVSFGENATDFEPAFNVLNPVATVETVDSDGVAELAECADATVGECEELNPLSFGFNCAESSALLTAASCLSFI